MRFLHWVLGVRCQVLGGWESAPSPFFPNTCDPKPIRMALACSGRGPLAVPPGLMHARNAIPRHLSVPGSQEVAGGASKSPRPTGTRVTRGTTLVDAASRRIHSRRSLARHSVLGYCARPPGSRGSRRPLRGEFWRPVAPGSHLPPALWATRQPYCSPSSRSVCSCRIAECTGHSGLLSTRMVKTLKTGIPGTGSWCRCHQCDTCVYCGNA
jgi:hypothetical protein